MDKAQFAEKLKTLLELGKKKKLRTEITMNKMNQEFLKILSGKHKKHRHRAYLCRC